MAILINLLLLFLSFLLEAISIYYLLSSREVFLFLMIHTASSTIPSTVVTLFLKRKLDNLKAFFLFSLIICLLIPIGGSLLFLIAFYFLYRSHSELVKLPSRSLDIDNVLNEFIVVKPRRFGEGALRLITTFKRKGEILLFLRDIQNPFAISVAKKFLKEQNDEVRLGAFSVLVKLEKEINNRINRLKELYETEKDIKKRAAIAKEIASCYWELLFFNLIDEELKEFILEEGLKYAQEALEVLEDTSSAFIAGRMFLKQKQLEQARKFLLFTYKNGDRLEKNRVIPYLAEVEYYLGNIRNVRALFKELPYSIYPNVEFSKIFWSGSEIRNS